MHDEWEFRKDDVIMCIGSMGSYRVLDIDEFTEFYQLEEEDGYECRGSKRFVEGNYIKVGRWDPFFGEVEEDDDGV